MHGNFWHTPIQYVIVDRLGVFLNWTRFIWKQCTVREYYSDLFDQSIKVRIRVKLRAVLF